MTDKSLLKAVLKLRKELGINGRCHIGFHYFISKISCNIFDWIKEKMMDKEMKFECTKDCKNKNTSECYELNCINGQTDILEQLARSEARVKELEEKYKWYDHYKDSALELKEKCNHLVDVNKKVKAKLDAQFAELEEKLTAEKMKNYELKEEIKELKAQRDTYISLMNVYKNISKGRQYNKTVTAYIDKLERKLQIAAEALKYYANGEDISKAKLQCSDAWGYIVDDNHTDIAKDALQKMEEEK